MEYDIPFKISGLNDKVVELLNLLFQRHSTLVKYLVSPPADHRRNKATSWIPLNIRCHEVLRRIHAHHVSCVPKFQNPSHAKNRKIINTNVYAAVVFVYNDNIL